jgi:two-component system, NtrC family, response regulator AtoC
VKTKIKIKIYSDKKDALSISPLIRQLSLEDTSIDCLTPQLIEIEPDEIIILLINSLSSGILDIFIKLKNSVSNKFLLVTRNNSALLISSLVKLGFTDIFLFPHEIPKFNSSLEKIIVNKTYLTLPPNGEDFKLLEFESIVGTSPRFSSVIEIIRKVSENRNISVLLLGETGTGKSLLAKAIHKNSKAGNSPFVEIVCSAIPEDLLESELFGHEKGAFTNAFYKKLGLFELAEKGTLFLDEIGDLSFNLQVKLLHVIEKKIIRRLGSVEDIPIETRIISATNKNLGEMVEKNLFRNDLYHRLNVVSILLPPLRERGNDVILLAEKFINAFNDQFKKSVDTLEDELKEFMLTYTWPGNVRELKNAIERAVLLSEDNILRIKDFEILLQNVPLNILENQEHIKFHPNLIRLDLNYKNIDLFKLSKLYAQEVLRKMEGNKSKSAQLLGISRPKLDKLINS